MTRPERGVYRVSQATYAGITAMAPLLRFQSTPAPGGMWDVRVTWDVVEAIEQERKPGEDDETLIARLLRRARN